MNRKTIKGFVLGMVTSILLLSSGTVFASSPIASQLQVYYNNIKVVVNGKPVEMGKDSTGKQIEPFIYNGTTYLPVRAVGEALGQEVDWDGAISTIYIGEKPGEVKYLTEILEPYNSQYDDYYKLSNKEKLLMSGNEYKTGLTLKASHMANHTVMYNLNSLYTEIEGYIGVVYSDTYDLSQEYDFNIYLDGKLYKTIVLTGDDIPQKVKIPVDGVIQIRFEALQGNNAYKGAILGIADMIIK